MAKECGEWEQNQWCCQHGSAQREMIPGRCLPRCPITGWVSQDVLEEKVEIIQPEITSIQTSLKNKLKT